MCIRDRLKALLDKAEASGDAMDAQKANDLAAQCDRFEKKLHDLKLTRQVSMQMAPQIRLLQNNDSLLVERIQSTLSNTLPLWKSQMVLALGYPAALFMADRKMKLGPSLVVLFIIPMWMNFLLRTIAWMSLLEDQGLINQVLRFLGFEGAQLMYNSGAVLLGMVYNFLPFMVFPIYTVLRKQDPKLGEAAQDMGCNEWRTLVKAVSYTHLRR